MNSLLGRDRPMRGDLSAPAKPNTRSLFKGCVDCNLKPASARLRFFPEWRLGLRLRLEHVPPQLNRGILVRRRMGESIGTDSLLGAGRCRGLIPGTCVSE